MGKQSAPPAPDYSSVAASNAHAADLQYQLGNDQLQFGKDQFNATWPYAQQFLQQQTESSAILTDQAQKSQAYYDTTYKPIETQFANEAANYNTPGRATQNAGAAMADVSNSFDANRKAALSSLESYGIDPSQTRYGALDLGTRISQAAATAAAGTQSRLNTEATGMAMQGSAINIGRGYPGQIAQDYSTATGAGTGGLAGANNTTNTGVNAMGTPASYFGGAQNALNGETSALNTSYSNQLAGSQFIANQSAQAWSGIGSMIGTVGAVAGAAMMM